MTNTPGKSTGYMRQLDGLRAVAVIAVAVFHWHHPVVFGVPLRLGSAGVNLFFVLSGFLITGILINVRERIGDDTRARIVALKAFWVRRFLRLAPALLFYLAVIYPLGYLDDKDGLLWYVAYLGNFRIAEIERWPSGVGHLWSLAVEEQFYLFIPLLVLWIKPQRLGHVLLAGTVISLVARGLWAESWARILPPAAFVGLFVGCGCAVLFQREDARRVGDRLSRFGTPVLVIAMLATGLESFSSGVAFTVAWLLYNLGAAGMVWRAANDQASSCYSWAPMVWLGRLSYGAYLWHFFASWLFDALVPGVPGPVRFVGAGIITCAMAKISMDLIEQRFIDKKTRYPYVKRVEAAQTSPAKP